MAKGGLAALVHRAGKVIGLEQRIWTSYHSPRTWWCRIISHIFFNQKTTYPNCTWYHTFNQCPATCSAAQKLLGKKCFTKRQSLYRRFHRMHASLRIFHHVRA